MTFIHKYTPYLLLMEVTLSVAFGHEASEELRALLEDFREMVNFAIESFRGECHRIRKIRSSYMMSGSVGGIIPAFLSLCV